MTQKGWHLSPDILPLQCHTKYQIPKDIPKRISNITKGMINVPGHNRVTTLTQVKFYLALCPFKKQTNLKILIFSHKQDFSLDIYFQSKVNSLYLNNFCPRQKKKTESKMTFGDIKKNDAEHTKQMLFSLHFNF